MAYNNKGKDKSALVFGKVPPQAQEIESVILGAMLLEREKHLDVFEVIKSDDCFYKEAHQLIFNALRVMYDKGMLIDMVTVVQYLRDNDTLELAGGPGYIAGLTTDVTSSAHVVEHCYILMEKYMQRELIRISGEVMNDAYNNTSDVFDLIGKAEADIYAISTVGMKKQLQHVSGITKNVMGRIEKYRKEGIRFTGVTTGYPAMNELMTGWQPTDLIIIGARPSVGKTAFTINTALRCAMDKENGGPVAMFNLEMSADQLVERFLSCLSGIPLDHIRKPHKLTEEELPLLDTTANYFATLKIYIDDTAGLTHIELRAKARRWIQKYGVKLIILDYLQLMEGTGDRNSNREQEISRISRALKKMAKDFNVPVIALSQLSRLMEKEKRAPQLSDLRESGAIEQDADLVMFLYRATEELVKAKPALKGKVLGTIAKSRHGSLGDVFFEAHNHIQRWLEHTGNFTVSVNVNSEERDWSKGSIIPTNSNNAIDDLPF